MARREYTGAAAPLVLAATITAGTTSITTTGTVTGWPTGASFPFVIEINRGIPATGEKILIQSRSGNTLTVAGMGRGYDGTTAQSHTPGAAVEHVIDALTIDEANAHVNDTARDDHTQLLNTARHDTPARHLLGTSINTGVPGTSAMGDTASEGASTGAARVDHRHAMPAFGAVGSVSAEAIGDTSSAGASAAVARIDHRHAMPGFGSPAALVVGGGAVVGVALTVPHSDHVHALPGGAAPAASTPGDAAVTGVASSVALSDHKHARETYPKLTQRTSQTIGTQGVNAGEDLTVMSDTFTVGTGGRVVTIDFDCDVRRNSAAGLAYAGNIQIKVDGVASGIARRYDSASHDNILNLHVNTTVEMTAGSHTVTVTASCDVTSDVGIFVYDRNLASAQLGGA